MVPAAGCDGTTVTLRDGDTAASFTADMAAAEKILVAGAGAANAFTLAMALVSILIQFKN